MNQSYLKPKQNQASKIGSVSFSGWPKSMCTLKPSNIVSLTACLHPSLPFSPRKIKQPFSYVWGKIGTETEWKGEKEKKRTPQSVPLSSWYLCLPSPAYASKLYLGFHSTSLTEGGHNTSRNKPPQMWKWQHIHGLLESCMFKSPLSSNLTEFAMVSNTEFATVSNSQPLVFNSLRCHVT